MGGTSAATPPSSLLRTEGGGRKEDRGELRVKEDPALRGDRPGVFKKPTPARMG